MLPKEPSRASAATATIVFTVPMKVGFALNTATPVPVSSVSAEARLALEGVVKNVATLEPNPERLATGYAVQLDKFPEVGVPRRGVTRVGVFANTREPVPVSSEITPRSCRDVVEANCDRGFATFPSNASNVADMSITGVTPPVEVILLAVPETEVTVPVVGVDHESTPEPSVVNT